MPQVARALGLTIAGAVLAVLAGCATTTTTAGDPAARSRNTPPPPSTRARAHSQKAPAAPVQSREAQLRSLYLEVSALRDSAREALAAGEAESAALLYREALGQLEAAELQPGEDFQLAGLWETILGEMRDLEVVALALSQDVGGEPHDTTPLQSLAELGPVEEDGAAGEEAAVEEPVPTEAVTYDIPVEVNAQVTRILGYYTGSRREIIARGLQRSGRFVPLFQEILVEEGLPADLAWLPLIESNFKMTALSRAGAKGIWQFIPSTGRKYGLRIDWYVDERSDPIKATHAAAAYLKDLYALFGDWYLALAAYNCGEGRVGRALRRTGEDDFWGLARARRIPRETRAYVPAFLAGLQIGKDPAAYGFSTETEEPWAFGTVEVEGPADLRVLAKCTDTDVATLRAMNPELRRWVTTGGKPYSLRVPPGAEEGFAERYAMVPLDQRLLYVEHRVRPGETVSKIARRHGTSVQAIAAENNLRNPNRISVGTVLRIPRSGSVPAAATPTRTAQKRRHSGSPASGVHVVRRRETLTSIAQRYGTTPTHLARQNGLRSMNRIYPGQRLKINSAAVAPPRAPAAAPVAAPAPSKPKKDPIVHTVRKGDTLYAIARAYNTSVSALRRWNRIGGTRIWPGDVIRIYH